MYGAQVGCLFLNNDDPLSVSLTRAARSLGRISLRRGNGFYHPICGIRSCDLSLKIKFCGRET